MLFFRPHPAAPKLGAPSAKWQHGHGKGDDNKPPANSGQSFYGLRLWPSIIISVLLWTAIIKAILWVIR